MNARLFADGVASFYNESATTGGAERHLDHGGKTMEQVFEGKPTADISLTGRRVTRTAVTQDWGSRLQWQIKRDGGVVATVAARADVSYQHADTTRGKYEIVLQMFKYVNYKKDAKGEYTDSHFVDISNSVTYTI